MPSTYPAKWKRTYGSTRLFSAKLTLENITDEHKPLVVAQLWALRRTLERMPDQLYLQSVIMRELVCTSVEEFAAYFAQRIPREIAKFDWVIDAKDPVRVTAQEEWWQQTLGPLIESRTRSKPFMHVKDRAFQYKLFIRSFHLVKMMWHPERPRERITGFDLRKLVMDRIRLVDSRTDVLIQAVDVLTGYIRRALNGEVTDAQTIKQLGRLQIKKKQEGKLQSVHMLSMSAKPRFRGEIMRPIGLMSKEGRSMLAR